MNGTVKHLDWHTLMTASADTPVDVTEALEDYFQPFAEPVFSDSFQTERPMLCLKCGEPLTGLLSAFIGKGGFQWGLVHGEGRCAGCGWPGRAIHYVKDKQGDELLTLRNYVLQYHPDVVGERASK